MTYVAPNRTASGNRLYTTDNTTFAHTCDGYRIYDYWDNHDEWVMNPSATSMRNLFAKYVSYLSSQGHLDGLFEDSAGSLKAGEVYHPFYPGLPCSYSDSAWITAEIGLSQAPSVPVIVNALSALNGHLPSVNIALLNGSNTIGANMEDCYSTNSQPKEDGWLWLAVENTELQVAAKGKLFECMLNNNNSASSQLDARLFAYASFLLTYNPSTSVYRTMLHTSSGLHVMPETELVPLQPVASAPYSVTGLEKTAHIYARQYNACYLRGTLVGSCAVVVNTDRYYAHPFPYTQYHHTFVISGGGVLDGGTVSTAGAAPPKSLPALEARIVFP